MFHLPSLTRLYCPLTVGGAPESIIDSRANTRPREVPAHPALPPTGGEPSPALLRVVVRNLTSGLKEADSLCNRYKAWCEENHVCSEELWRVAIQETFLLESKRDQPPPGDMETWKTAFYAICHDIDRLGEVEQHELSKSRHMSHARITRTRAYYEHKTDDGGAGFPGLSWLFASRGGEKSNWTRWRMLDDKLFKAAKRNDAKGVRDLLAEGASPNAANGYGRVTPLIAAIASSNRAAAVVLLNHPVTDVRVQDRHGLSALGWAKESNDYEMIRLLDNARDLVLDER
jgi:hypothetical protein